MIRHLAKRHSVVVASLAHSEQELQEGEGLNDHCEEVIAEVLPNSIRWLQAFKALTTSTPSSVAYFESPRLHARIRERTLRTKFDLAFLHCAFVAQYAKDCPGIFRVLDYGDIDSAKWAEYARWHAWPLSFSYRLESKKLRRYERAVATQFDRFSVTSISEEEEFQSLGIDSRCDVIPNGVDTSYFSFRVRKAPANASIAFLGRMDYFPNIDGVCYFVDKILPIIRTDRPEAQLQIIGSNPSPKVKALARIAGVTVTGHVPDVRPYVANASVAIAPLRIARGTQNKILESMAMGIPLVASPQAAKGVQAIPGRDLLVADTPQTFAQHVLDILASPQLSRSLSEAARSQVEKAHSWSTSMRLFDQLVNQPVGS